MNPDLEHLCLLILSWKIFQFFLELFESNTPPPPPSIPLLFLIFMRMINFQKFIFHYIEIEMWEVLCNWLPDCS